MNIPIKEIIQSVKGVKVAVLGDPILDVYIEGNSNRISSEAPVPIVDVEKRQEAPGGAANTVLNVATLGGQARFISAVGDDKDGRAVKSLLAESGVDVSGVVTDPSHHTTVKSRLNANSQVIVRFDFDATDPISEDAQDAIIEELRAAFTTCDALIVSDYGYGIVTGRIIEALRDLQAEHDQIIVVDSKNLPRFASVDITGCKPNYPETVDLLGLDHLSDSSGRIEQMEEHGERVLDLVNTRIAAVTLDDDGGWIFERGHAPYRTYTTPVENSKAVGAGDTFVAALALALGAGVSIPVSGEFAAAATRLVVEQDGTTPCRASELEKRIAEGSKWVTARDDLREIVERLKAEGRRIVFTNGIFDILNRGHVTYLSQAKALGDVLIVGVNTDESVQRLKGDGRPINSLEDRIQTLSGLSSIDHVTHFEEDTSEELIKIIQPDVYVKGSDYSEATLPEAPLVKEQGGRIEFLDIVEDGLTAGIIEKVKQTL